MKLKLANIDEKFILLLIVMTPLIDLVNGFFVYVLKSGFSPGVIIRSTILVIIIMFYIKKRKQLLLFIFLISLFLLEILLEGLFGKVSIMSEVSFVSKIYYNMFLMYVIENNIHKISFKKLIDSLVMANLIVTFSLIVTKVLGIGMQSYGESGGYKGLYMGLNDLTGVVIMTFPFLIYKFLNNKNSCKYGILVIISAVNIILIGTKTSLVFLIVIIIFVLYELLFKEKKVFNIILVIFFVTIFMIIFKKYFWNSYSSSILARLYYHSEQQDYSTFILSGRNKTLAKSMLYWSKNVRWILSGIGFTEGSAYIGTFLESHGMIEMDFFDSLYFYGAIFTIILFVPLFKKFIKSIFIFVRSKELLYKLIAFVYMISALISFLGGHIILSPLAGVYFVLLAAMLKKIA